MMFKNKMTLEKSVESFKRILEDRLEFYKSVQPMCANDFILKNGKVSAIEEIISSFNTIMSFVEKEETERMFFCIEELRYDKDGQQLWCVMFPNQIFDSREEAYKYLDIFVPNWKDQKERFRTEGLVYRIKDSEKEHWEE